MTAQVRMTGRDGVGYPTKLSAITDGDIGSAGRRIDTGRTVRKLVCPPWHGPNINSVSIAHLRTGSFPTSNRRSRSSYISISSEPQPHHAAHWHPLIVCTHLHSYSSIFLFPTNLSLTTIESGRFTYISQSRTIPPPIHGPRCL